MAKVKSKAVATKPAKKPSPQDNLVHNLRLEQANGFTPKRKTGDRKGQGVRVSPELEAEALLREVLDAGDAAQEKLDSDKKEIEHQQRLFNIASYDDSLRCMVSAPVVNTLHNLNRLSFRFSEAQRSISAPERDWMAGRIGKEEFMRKSMEIVIKLPAIPALPIVD